MAIRKTKPTAAPAPAPMVRSEIKGSGSTVRPPAAAREITRDMIAKRAYDIYASRGFAPGNPQADWLEAERQLRAGL